jgi:DNA-binding SARP family transcriptional activator
VEFRILGPVDALDEGRALPIGGPRQRALLALLLLNANEIVSSARLIDELWTAERPKDPPTALQNQVSRLRKALDGRLIGRSHGYVMRVEPGELDLERFRSLVAEAADADADKRAHILADALALWHGKPLSNVAREPFAEHEAARLEEMRLAALEERIDADLVLGRHAELIGELHGLVVEHPLRERLRGQLMLALYRCGRQVEALDVFREGRRMLVEELGLEPSPELKALEGAILRQDPGLAVPRAPRGISTAEAPSRRWRRRALVAGLAAVALLVPTILLALTEDGETPTSTPGAATTSVDATPPDDTKRRTSPKRSTHPAQMNTADRPRPRRQRSEESATRRRATPAATTSRPSKSRASAPTPPSAPRTRSLPPARARSAARSKKPAAPATTRQGTTTSRKRPSPPAVTPPAPGQPRRITDDFGDGRIDPRTWHLLVTGTEVNANERNGRFEVSIGPNAVAGGAYNVIDGHLGTHCRFAGDFDARVEYELLRWPPANGVNVGLAAFFANARVLRESEPAGDFYESWIPPRFHQATAATGTNGAFRLARVGGAVTAYYRAGDGRWVTIDSARATGIAVIGPSATSTNEAFGHTQVEVAFDNFVVEGNAINCPPS